MERQKTQNKQCDIEERNKFGGLILHNFKTYCNAIVIRIVWYGQKNRQISHRNRIENNEIDT